MNHAVEFTDRIEAAPAASLDARLVSRWIEYHAEAMEARLRLQLAEIESRRLEDDWHVVNARHRAFLTRRRARLALEAVGGNEQLLWCQCS